MAYEIPGFKLTLTAGESLTTKQFYFAKISADNTCVMATELTDIPCGIIQNNPASGEATEIMVNGVSKVLVGAGGAVTAGQLVGCDADGKLVVVDPDGVADYYFVGQVLEGAGAAEYATILFNCMTPVIQSGS
jgi:hypothetical protein